MWWWCPLCGVTRIDRTLWFACAACADDAPASVLALYCWINDSSEIPRSSRVWRRDVAQILHGRRPLEVPQ